MKTKYTLIALFALMLFIAPRAQAQSDTLVVDSIIEDVEIESDGTQETVIVNGKKIKVIVKEKEVIKKAPNGIDSTIEREIEDIEVEIEAMEDELEEMEREIIIIEEYEDDERERKIVDTDWFNLQIGLNNALNSSDQLEMPAGYENMEISTGKSVNAHLHIVQQALNLYRTNVRLIYGLGIDFNNYRFNRDVVLGMDSMGVLTADLNEDVEYKKNKLNTQYLTVPLMLNLRFGNEDDDMFNISFGPNFGYLIGSSQKLKWSENGKQKSKIKDDYNLEKFRIGYEVQFGYGNFILFAKYFPKSMFKTDLGPNIRTVSAGILLGSI
jgi:hypothetical protein